MGKHLGFTGSRQGVSPTQDEELGYLLADLYNEGFRYADKLKRVRKEILWP